MLIAVEINIDWQVAVEREEGWRERGVPTADTFVTNSLRRMLQLPPLLALFFFVPLRRKYLADTKAISARGFDKLACCLFRAEVR